MGLGLLQFESPYKHYRNTRPAPRQLEHVPQPRPWPWQNEQAKPRIVSKPVPWQKEQTNGELPDPPQLVQTVPGFPPEVFGVLPED